MFEGADTAEGLSTVTAGQALRSGCLRDQPYTSPIHTGTLEQPHDRHQTQGGKRASLRPSAHSPRIPASSYAHNAAARHAVAHRFGMAPVD